MSGSAEEAQFSDSGQRSALRQQSYALRSDKAPTRADICAVHEILLGRQPENDQVIEALLNRNDPAISLARSLCESDEFCQRIKRQVDPVTRADVRGLYQVLLGRKPESDEIVEKQRSWHSSTISLARALCGSDEARLRARSRADVPLTEADVRTLYQTLLRRQPESDQAVATQLSLHNSAISLVHSLCDSDEGRRRIAGDIASPLTRAEVRALYQIVLGRQPKSEEAVERELSLHDTVLSLAHALCVSDEFSMRVKREVDGPLRRADVRMLYETLFGWQPESNEIIETQLNSHNSLISLARSLCDSDEARSRVKGGYGRLFDGYSSDELEILRRHRADSVPEAGFVKDFVGTRMRIEFADFTSSFSGVVFDRIPVPGDFRVEAIEWIGALKAVEASGSHFVTVELGAGWGPFAVSSGHVARRLGKTVRMYAAEADPGKVPTIAQHMIDNGFDPNDHVIFGGIVGPSDGFAYFPVIDAVGNWGGEAVYSEPPLGDYHKLPSISLRTLLKDEAAVDLVHFDIQGAELDVVRASLDALCAKVKWLVIGTHSRSIEGSLIDLLLPANWSLENEQPCRCSYENGRSTIIVDGTQVWKNLNFNGSCESMHSASGQNKMPQIARHCEADFAQRGKPEFADCYFYHTINLPGHGEILGPWDLRGREARYIGNVPLAGKRVLEVGPASGGLTNYIERQGANVVCIETTEELAPDVLPNPRQDVASQRNGARNFLRALTNAWWYTKHALGLSARIAYGDITSLPGRIGAVDICFIGCVLQHCRSPFDVVHQGCVAAREAVIVTDALIVGLENISDSLMRFNPTRGEHPHSWWDISPGAIVNMLKLHGFDDVVVSYHDHKHYLAHDLTRMPIQAPLFTVVGRR